VLIWDEARRNPFGEPLESCSSEEQKTRESAVRVLRLRDAAVAGPGHAFNVRLKAGALGLTAFCNLFRASVSAIHVPLRYSS